MADDIYTPPDSTNLPFNFTEKGYSSPDSTNTLFNFTTPGNFGNLRAAVNAMGMYWYETYTYPKTCPKYVIGYGSNVQIIRGRCVYGGIRDLRATIEGVPVIFGEENLPASINAVLNSGQSNLGGITKGWAADQKDLSAYLKTIYAEDLGASFTGTHDPVDLPSYVSVFGREQKDLNAYLRGWGSSDLNALIGAMQISSIPASVNAIEPGDLPAYLKTWPQSILSANTYGWGSSYLTAYLNQILKEDLAGSISGHLFVNLGARLRGYVSSYSNLPASLVAWSASDLQGIVRATYFSDLTGYVFPILPVDLPSFLHAWHIKDLQGIVNVQDYPWNLTANITATGQLSQLAAIINPLAAAQNYINFPGYIHAWHPRNLSGYISAETAPYLRATLTPVGYASNLHASIYPKVIRLTTVVSISTLAHKDLSAMINSPCFYTNYSTLIASIIPTYKSDLAAYVRPIVYDYKPALLGAKVGYADSYLEVDKLSFNIAIKPSDFYTLDKYKLMVTILNSGSLLSAYINATPRYTDLSSYINGQAIDSYTYDSLIKNRERVINKTYDGVFTSFETVEMAFKSAVEDYYYSSDGDYAWKKDRLERWMLDVRSILPANTALKLKRRLHRATELYDLKKFVSVDEAMRFAIAYVTEYPQASLSASIVNRGTFAALGGMLNPRYLKSDRTVLTSSINPVGDTVVVSSSGSISKI